MDVRFSVERKAFRPAPREGGGARLCTAATGRGFITRLYLVLRLRMNGAVPQCAIRLPDVQKDSSNLYVHYSLI